MFVEQFCHHHEGELAPQRIKLELWQKALLSVIFGIVDEDGYRQFREVFIVMGRKNGKTLLASCIAEYCTFLDGEYGGIFSRIVIENIGQALPLILGKQPESVLEDHGGS